jgi:hypothetical protein
VHSRGLSGNPSPAPPEQGNGSQTWAIGVD